MRQSEILGVTLTLHIEHDLPGPADAEPVVGGAGVDAGLVPAHGLDEDLLPGAPDARHPRPAPRHAGRGVGVCPAPDHHGLALAEGHVARAAAAEVGGHQAVGILVLHRHHGNI